MTDSVEFLMEHARAVSNIGKPKSDNNYGRAATEIKALREENKSLKERVEYLEGYLINILQDFMF